MPEDEEIARSVRAHGWYAISVTDHPPEFTYTCGLTTTFQHPEAIIFGLPGPSAHSMLAAMAEDIRRGRTFASPGRYEGVLIDLPVATRRVHPRQQELYLGYAMGHCRYMGSRGGLIAVQVFWPDKAGR
ncbi:MAG TPA: DUF4262 domain-containing protein, partial [Gemmataceae bacterium]|nr:DUF4262 domain-containing protein [Gemmataceae bacterium]